jgi:anti-anti-sigma regulatory factor
MACRLPSVRSMLRIRQVADSGTEITLLVEGRIVSEWVGVLERECRQLRLEPRRRLGLDLTAVTFIDKSGVSALRRLVADGVAIVHVPEFIDALLGDEGEA